MLTNAEYELHLDFMAKRNEIIERYKNKPATHKTTRAVWHGYERPAGTPLIYSSELHALFLEHAYNTARVSYPNSAWFIEPNGDICNLWATEYTEINNRAQ